ncbi:MAG: hypothetical protein HOP33_00535 [Verrucomicrobia bacterium]|nr:hypothetical protein [Verrucomicrobiota bacterium]
MFTPFSSEAGRARASPLAARFPFHQGLALIGQWDQINRQPDMGASHDVFHGVRWE